MLEAAKPFVRPNEIYEGNAIVLLPSDIQAINPYLGLNVTCREDLIERIKMLTTLRIENTDVIFEPALLQRLKSRCLKKGDFPVWLAERVKEWAHAYVGW